MASSEQSGARRKVRDEMSSVTADIHVADQATANITKYNCPTIIQSPPPAKEECFEDLIDWESKTVKQYVNEFIELQNNYTKVKTEDSVTATFTNLITPEKQVNPQYIDTNFYQGHTALKTQEYVPDSLFEGREERSINGKFIALTKLLDGVDYTALIADAGAGKTTSAKRFARMILENQIPSLKKFKVVRYVTIASLNSKKEYTAFDLFFAKGMGDKLTDGMKKYGRYWVKKHSHEILLVLDGMDQANWVLDKNIEEDISYDELASVPVVFRNVLRKNLFQKSKIVITSREQAMLKFPPDVRPKRTVALNGLSEEDQEYLIKQLAGERGEGILHHLRGAPFLMSLCRTPAFLVFSVAVFEDNLGNLPETMSEILIRVLAYFIISENKRECSMGDQIFNKLKKLAFNGTSMKRVLFTWEEVQELGLDPAKVCDLVVTTPHKSTTKAFHFIERRSKLFFCHQSIQEALTALHICDMPLGDFEKFFYCELLQPHYSIVRRIVCGVLLNPRMNDVEPFLEPSEDRQQKSKVVRDWLENLASAFKESSRWLNSDDVELCRLLQECGESANDIIRKHLFPLKDNYEGFKTRSFFVFISSLSQLDELVTDEVKVVAANSSELKLFADCLSKMRYVQVDKLVIAADRHLSALDLFLRRKLMRHPNAVDRRRPKRERKCHSNDLHIKDFRCLGSLFISGFQSIRQMIRQFKIDEVVLYLHSPTSAELSKLQDNLTANEGFKINSLKFDIFRIWKSEPGFFAHIGEIIARCNIEELKLDAMKITINRDSVTSGCKRLIFKFGEHLPISILDHISLITKHCEIDEINLSNCNLSVENLGKLKIALVRSGKLIRLLRFHGNKELDVASFQFLGEIIRQCKVKEVWMKWPNISDDKISALHTFLKGHNVKLKLIIIAGSGNEFVSTLTLNENK